MTKASAFSGLATNNHFSVVSWTLDVERSFDPAARLSSLSYAYCGWNGLVSAVANSALTVEYGYDIMDRVTNTVYRNASGTVVGAFSYRRDALGLVTQKVSLVGASANAYDALGRRICTRSRSTTNHQPFSNVQRSTVSTNHRPSTALGPSRF